MIQPASMTILELCKLYQAHADEYYRKHGRPTRHANNIRDALREWCSVCGEEPIASFTARRLRDVQQAMVASGRLCRTTVSTRIKTIRAAVTWAAEMELPGVDELLPHRLRLVRALKPGRTSAPEGRGVQPVDWDIVSATMAAAPLRLSNMIEVHWHTGMRPGELCAMTVGSIRRHDESGGPTPVWLYTPAEHKTEHHGQQRIVPLGPLVQGLLARWIAVAEAGGIQPLWPGRDGKTPIRPLSYYRAIRRINDREEIRGWHPNQIRHAAATRLRKELGIEAARVILGHRSATTTEIYAEVDRQKAIDLMGELG